VADPGRTSLYTTSGTSASPKRETVNDPPAAECPP